MCFLATVFYILCSITNSASVAFVHDRVPPRATAHPLPDLVLDHVVPYDQAQEVAEALLLLSFITSLAIAIFHKHR